MGNNTEIDAAQERLRLAQERVAAAETLIAGARDELAAANAHMASLPDATAERDEPIVGDNWPYATLRTTAPTSPKPTAPLMPTYRVPPARTTWSPSTSGPVGWRSRRAGTVWGVVVISIAASLFLQWIAQIIVGAFVGTAVGIDGINGISMDEFNGINATATVTALLFTFVVTLVNGVRTHRNLTWLPSSPDSYGMSWFHDCWLGILLGIVGHALIFLIAFGSATS